MALQDIINQVLSQDMVFIFIAFVLFVVIMYKSMNLFIHALLIAIAAFSFPWIANAIGLPVPANVQTAIYFSLAGLGLFFVYNFLHLFVKLLEIAVWPFRALLGWKKKKKVEKLEEEVEELEEHEKEEHHKKEE